MKASPSLSDTFRRLKPRERLVVLGGAIVSAVALAVVGIGVPFAHHWTEREAAYTASRDQWTRLATLAASTDRLQHALEAEKRAFAADEERLVPGATPALAASTLQGLVQRYAGETNVQLERIDVAGDPKPDKPGLLAIPVQLQARGDVYGLVNFLGRLQHGDKLLVVDELTLDSGPGAELSAMPLTSNASDQALSWTMRLHGLYEGTTGGSP
jgi:type II secretory pathway component PulM